MKTLRQIMTVAALPLLAVTILPREPDELRLGQRVYVDDGTCPAGQVKEVAGANLTPNGISRARQCVARNTLKR